MSYAGRTGRGDAVAAAGLAAAACVFFAVDLIGSGTRVVEFTNVDLYTEFLPRHAFAGAALRRGVLPLWDAHQFGGLPFLATWQAGVLYPPNLLYAVAPVGTAMGILALVHLVLAGIFTFGAAREMGASRAAAALAGLTFMLGGSTVSLVYHTNAIAAAPWLPAAVWCTWRLGRDPRLRWALALSAVLALQALAGRDYVFVMTLHTVGLLGLAQVVWMLRDGVAPGRIAAHVARLALGVALAAALAAAQLFPTLALAAESDRRLGGLPAELLEIYGPMPPAFFIANLVNPVRGVFRREYFGWIPLLCFAIGLRLWGRDRAACFASILTLAALVLALGSQTPVYAAYRYVPLGAAFRLPDRFVFVFGFGLALVAASGFDRVFSARGTRRAVLGTAARVLALGAALLLLLNGPWLAAGLRQAAEPWRWFTFYGFDPRHFAALGRAYWYFAGASVLLAIGLRPSAGRGMTAVRALVLVLATADLTYALASRVMHPARDATPALAAAPCYAQAAAVAGPYGRHLSFRAPGSWALKDKDGELFGGFAATHYDPLVTRRHAAYLAALQEGGIEIIATPWNERSPFMGFLTRYPRAERLRLLDLLGVGVVLMDAGDPPQGLRDLRAHLEPVGRCPVSDGGRPLTVELLQNGHALPRAFVVHAVERVATPEAALARLVAADFDPRRRAVVEDARGAAAMGADDGDPGRAEIVAYGPREVVVRVETPRPGLLVLTDTWDADWRATLDGKAVPVHPTDALFRGVDVPAGSSEVVFRYVPTAFDAGVTVSLLGAGVWAALWIGSGRRTRP